MLNAFSNLLCSKLCWHNRLVPTGDLRMVPSPPDKQPAAAGYKSPHDWLVRLGMDLAILCV